MNPADFNDAEIRATNLGNRGATNQTTPVHVEHDTSQEPVGRVLASYPDKQTGAMRVAGVVDDAETAQRVRSGELRGLSLSTHMQWQRDEHGRADMQQPPASRIVEECSLCVEPGRAGCYIDTVDHVRIPSTLAAFSATAAKGQLRGCAISAKRIILAASD